VIDTGGGLPTPPSIEGVTMFVESGKADPAVHALCIRITMKCFSIIRVMIPEEATAETLRQFYSVCREQLDKPPAPPEV
jgi:hypothetical protein